MLIRANEYCYLNADQITCITDDDTLGQCVVRLADATTETVTGVYRVNLLKYCDQTGRQHTPWQAEEPG
jgi:hypothetical protein